MKFCNNITDLNFSSSKLQKSQNTIYAYMFVQMYESNYVGGRRLNSIFQMAM